MSWPAACAVKAHVVLLDGLDPSHPDPTQDRSSRPGREDTVRPHSTTARSDEPPAWLRRVPWDTTPGADQPGRLLAAQGEGVQILMPAKQSDHPPICKHQVCLRIHLRDMHRSRQVQVRYSTTEILQEAPTVGR